MADSFLHDFDRARNYATNYLRTYYAGTPPPDEHTVMHFLAREAHDLPEIEALLEIGCGPCIHHILSLAPRVKEVHLRDYRADNLEAVRSWKERLKDAHDWTAFTELALQAEGTSSNDDAIADREQLVRESIKSIGTCDLRTPTVLTEAAPGSQFPLVTCFYATEQAATDTSSWREAFRNLTNLVEPDGTLLFSAVGRTHYYVVRNEEGVDERYAVPYLTGDDVLQALRNSGFDPSRSRVEERSVQGQETDGVHSVILTSARKLQDS